MTTDRNDGLESFLAAAREAAPRPTGDLMARIEAQALAEQLRPGARTARLPVWRMCLDAVGGWPGAAGLVAAGLAGLWLGISPPGSLDGVLGTDTASLGTLGVDPLTGYDLALVEG